MTQQHQPTDKQIENSRLIYCRLSVDELETMSPKWKLVAGVNWDFQEWFQAAVDEALKAYGLDMGTLKVHVERRPPYSSGLIPGFFLNLDPITQSLLVGIASNAAWDGFLNGIQIIRREIRKRLQDHGMPETAFKVYFSGKELEDLCTQYVRAHFHPRATLRSERTPFNTKYEGGYAWKIDQALPMGWQIIVATARTKYVFIAESNGNVLSIQKQSGKRIIEIAAVNLLENQLL